MKVTHNQTIAEKRAIRVRAKLHGTEARPRFSVFKSNNHLYFQAINDDAGHTMLALNDAQKDIKVKVKGKKALEGALIMAEHVAEKMKKANILTVIFDRGPYRYHGRIKAIADVLRKNGITV